MKYIAIVTVLAIVTSIGCGPIWDRWPEGYTCDPIEETDVRYQARLCNEAGFSSCTKDAVLALCSIKPKCETSQDCEKREALRKTRAKRYVDFNSPTRTVIYTKYGKQ